MPREDLQWIDLTDFTPGIHSNYHSTIAGEMQPDGAAQERGTYGCVALPSGGLVPLPRWTIERTGNTFTADGTKKWPTETGDPAFFNQRVVVLDARAVGPITFNPPLTEAVNYALPPTDLFMVRQMWWRRTATNEPEPQWYYSNHREYLGSPYTLNGHASHYLDGFAQAAQNSIPNRWRYGGGSLAETRTVAKGDNSTKMGNPVVVAAMGGPRLIGGLGPSDPEGLDVFEYVTYPDVYLLDDPKDQPRVNDKNLLNVTTPAAIIFGHQGRLMGLGRTSGYKYLRRFNYHGDEHATRSYSEEILYWPPNDVYIEMPDMMTVMEESSSGYGAYCSVSADSLLLVKHVGGAVLINGDVEDPTVVRLPGIPSTGGVTSRGIMTKLGFIYGSVSGVWAWTGSDTAEPLSTNLRPDFWIPDDPSTTLRERETNVGSFGYRHPFIFAPNNWVLDTRTNSWWRYASTPAQDTLGISTNSRTYAFCEVDGAGKLWAFVPSYVQPDTYMRMFDPDTPAGKYVWQSQPLSRSKNRYLNYRQVVILATGVGTVQVQVRGVDGVTQTATLTVNSDRVARVYGDIAVTTTDVEVTITATATDPDDPAPTVHRVSLGYRENQSADRAGTIRGN